MPAVSVHVPLQALAEELWREQNYGAAEAAALEAGEEAGVALSLGEIGGVGPSPLNSSDLGGAGTGAVTTAGGRGTQPWSPGAPVRQAASMPAAIMAAAAGPGPGASGGSGSGRATPPPPLRLPGSWTAGPPTGGGSSSGAAAGSGGAGGSGGNNGLSPMLRSRPMNLTPTLHHISQAGGGAASSAAGSAAPSPGAAGGAAAAAPASVAGPSSPSGSTTSTSGMNSARMSLSGGAAAGPAGAAAPPGAGVAASLPQLSRPGTPGSRMSGSTPAAGMPSVSAGQVLQGGGGGGGGGGGLEPEASGSSFTSGRASRFSVPGSMVSASVDFSMVSAAGGGGGAAAGARAVAALEDGISLQEAAAAGKGASKGPKWSMPRFLGGGKGKGAAAGAGAAAEGDGGAAATGPPNGKRGPKGSLLAAGGDELGMVARAQSWAGPMANPALGPPAVPHSRSLGPADGPAAAGAARAAAAGMAPAPPTAPAPPAGAGRNPRNRRSSAVVLGSSGSPLPPSFIAAMGKVSTDGSAALSTPGEAPASPGWSSRGPAAAGGSRGLRAGSISGAAGLTARSSGGAPGAGGGGGGGVPRRAGAFGAPRGSTSGEGAPTPGGGRRGSVSGGGAAAASAAATAAAAAAAVARRVAAEGGSEAVFLRFQEEQAALEKPLRMMNMYANRANARWVEELASAVGGGGAPPPLSPPGGAEGGPKSLASPTGTASTAGTGAGSGGGGFEPPQVYEAAKFASVMGAAQSAAFKSEVAAALRAGRMAVQVLAGDDNVILASGTTQALWNADPWDLIATAFPAKVPALGM